MEGKVNRIGGSSAARVASPYRPILARRERLIAPAGLVLSLTLAGLVLRITRLDFQPLWWDEGYSAWFATHPLGQMMALTAEDIHPPLYYALLHLWTLIAGPGPVSLRLLSVAVGVAAIPLVYATALRIFGSQRIALLAAFLLAVNPLHVYYSQEVRMYGLVALLSTGILWAGWGIFHGRATRSDAAAYVVLATLALYTQYYAVFVPIGLTLYALWRWRKEGRKLLRWFGLQLLAAVLYLPWVIYAGPRLTLYVSQKVVQDADRPLDLVAYFARHLAAFLAGHLEGALAPWWPTALLLLVPIALGLALFIREARASLDRREMNVWATEQRLTNKATAGDTAAFLGVVLLVALLLGWLIGLRYPFFPDRGERLLLLALPAFVMLAAAGLVGLSGFRVRARGLSGLRNLTGRGILAALFVVVSAASLGFFYSVPRYPGDDYRPLIARTVEQGLPGDTVFCIYPWQVGYWRSYAASVDGPTAILTPSVKWDTSLQGALDAALAGGHVWFPAHLALGGILETQVEQYLASRAIPFVNTWYGPGTRLSGWQALALSDAAASNAFLGAPIATYALPDGGHLALVGAPATSQPIAAANVVAPVTLGWQAQQQPQLAVSVRLVDDLGQIWAQNDYEPLGSMVGSQRETSTEGGWQAVDRLGLLVPAGTPPGRYKAELVVLQPENSRPLIAQIPGGRPTSGLHLFDIDVTAAGKPLSPDRLPVTHWETVDLGDGIRFLGFTVDGSPLAPGDLRRVNLFWQATARPGSDYTAFVQLLGNNGAPVAAWEAPPGAAYATSEWTAGTLVRTQAFFRPGAELPDGHYSLIAGLYRPADGARLKTSSGKDSLQLGSIQVHGRPRQTTAPKPQFPADASFGAVARLTGYDVSPDRRQITLYWEALGTTERPYTVFVHVLAGGDQVTGYGDSEPGNGAYPTTGWRKGEYLTDVHTIETAGGAGIAGARLLVGLYDPTTGERLLTQNGKDAVIINVPE